MLKNKKILRKKVLIPIIVIAICGIAAGVYFGFIKDNSPKSSTPASTVEVANQDINFDPPTEEEKKENEKAKDEKINANPTPSVPVVNGKRQVTPVVTYAMQEGQQITINSFVSGVVEDSGTCTATFQLNGLTVTKTTEGFANATTTNCSPFFIGRADFPKPGDWQLTLSYASGNASGSAAPKTVTIQ